MDAGRHIHLVGVGGAGMSAIARILLEMGCRVSGSDISKSPRTESLRILGARIFLGHRSSNVDGADLVVASSAIRQDNPELAEARRRRLPVVSRAHMLARLMEGRYGIAVSGTHGKTTTTSMVAVVLERAGLEPTIVIGGELGDIGSNAKLGNGHYVVAEADESDASFLELSPRLIVVTNVDADHLDHYRCFDDIVRSFALFLDKLPPDGTLVACADDPGVRDLLSRTYKPSLTYGLDSGARFTARNIVCRDLGSSFEVFDGETGLGALSLNVPGVHNIVNALASCVVATHLSVPFDIVGDALRGFRGAKRRFQILGRVGDVLVVDDYAHHPTEVRATLSAAKGLNRRIVAIFQPHRYSRTHHLAGEFASAFGLADVLVLTEIFGALEDPIPGVDARGLVQKIQAATSQEVHFIPDKRSIVDFLQRSVEPGDLVLTMGAGDIYTVAADFLAQKAAIPGGQEGVVPSEER